MYVNMSYYVGINLNLKNQKTIYFETNEYK